jgi:hypothetical protein
LKKLFLILLTIVLLLSCSSDDDFIDENNNPIVGNWRPKTLTWETIDNEIKVVSLTDCQQEYSMLKFGDDQRINFGVFPYLENPEECYRMITTIGGFWEQDLVNNQYLIFYRYFNLDEDTHLPDYENPQNGVFEFNISFSGEDKMIIHEQDMLGYFVELLPKNDIKTYFVSYNRSSGLLQ